jgi:hypothetical protein
VEGILGDEVVEELDRKIEREENLFLRKAKTGKYAGNDGYPMEFWKEIIKNEEIGKMITKVMNKIYETGKLPIAWQTIQLYLIYKGKGDREDPGNYKCTALLSTLSKIYTGVLAKRLNDWIENREAISECQMGFRKGQRTTNNIFYNKDNNR